MTKVLLTGAGGFIGAHCVEYFLRTTDWDIVALDSFRHKGNYSRLNEVDDLPNERVQIVHYDLSTPLSDPAIKKIGDIDIVLNMASDSAVERSLTDPVFCLRNNYDIVVNMLEYARKVKPKVFFQVSTDEVFGDCPEGEAFAEWQTPCPSNPYAASKAAQEMVAISYWRTFGVPVVLTNTTNNIGEWQDCEKFLPKMIRKIANGEEMPIYANFDAAGTPSIGKRSYLYVKNHADVFVYLSKQPVSMYPHAERPDRYNVCGDAEVGNLELAQMVAGIMGKEVKYKLVPAEGIRPGYDKRYSLDGKKLLTMGWKPPILFTEGLQQAVRWTMNHAEWM